MLQLLTQIALYPLATLVSLLPEVMYPKETHQGGRRKSSRRQSGTYARLVALLNRRNGEEVLMVRRHYATHVDVGCSEQGHLWTLLIVTVRWSKNERAQKAKQ